MTFSRRAAGSLILLLVLLGLAGCSGPEPDSSVEEVLQLDNDILEDPLLKEMDALEASLLSQEAEAQATESAEGTTAAVMEPTLAQPAPVKTAPLPAGTTAAAPATPAAEAPVPPADAFKKTVFGVVKKTSGNGLALRVIETKQLTADELRRIRNGEKISQILLTDEVLRLVYNQSVLVEKMVAGAPAPASQADVVSGQTVRVTLNRAGEITYLRIIRY